MSATCLLVYSIICTYVTGIGDGMRALQWLVFKTVVEKKSFSLAARELYMTQSAVSQHIRNLEVFYGVKLFDRLHRRIEVTPAGLSLYPLAVQMVQLFQAADKIMRSFTAEVSGRLHIGASLTVGEYILPELLVQFRQRYPKVDITMDIYNTEQVVNMVTGGGIDVGFIEAPYATPGTLARVPYGGDRLVIIASPSYAVPTGVPISLAALMKEKWVMREPSSGTRRVFEQFAARHGYDVAALDIMELGSTQAIKEAVKAGVGLAPVSHLAIFEELRQNLIRIIPLAEGPIERSFTILYHLEKYRTFAAEKFLAFLKIERPHQYSAENAQHDGAEQTHHDRPIAHAADGADADIEP